MAPAVFSLPVMWAYPSKTPLNSDGDNGHMCLFPDLSGSISVFSLIKMLPVGSRKLSHSYFFKHFYKDCVELFQGFFGLYER